LLACLTAAPAKILRHCRLSSCAQGACGASCVLRC
jgi:hypothetical protein